MPIYNKKPMPLRKGIGFCQQSASVRVILTDFLLQKQKNYDIITSVRFLVHIGNVFD